MGAVLPRDKVSRRRTRATLFGANAGRAPASVKRQLHPDVSGDKAEPLVKAMRIGTRAVAGQLHEAAAVVAGEIDRMTNQGLAEPGAALGRGDPHALDLGSLDGAAGEAGDHGQLQAADNDAIDFRDKHEIARLRRNLVEAAAVRGRIDGVLACPPQWIVGEERDNRRQVTAAGLSDQRMHSGE
jgi:hypothetical protein